MDKQALDFPARGLRADRAPTTLTPRKSTPMAVDTENT